MNKKVLNIFVILIVLFFWFIPIAMRGLFKKPAPWVPKDLSYFEGIAGLFVFRADAWTVYYIQVQPAKEGPWVTLPEDHFFKMQPFGWRTRFQRYIFEYPRGSQKDRAYRELADWIRDRLAAEGTSIHGIRFIEGIIPPSTAPSPTIAGHWQNPDIATLPSSQQNIVFSSPLP